MSSVRARSAAPLQVRLIPSVSESVPSGQRGLVSDKPGPPIGTPFDPNGSTHKIIRMDRIAVVAAVIEHQGRILCAQRPDNKFAYISRKWEFPGGKIENCETQQEALAREITEELCINVDVGESLLTVEHSYPDFHLTMHAFRCTLSPGTRDTDLKLKEHIDLQWLRTTECAFVQLDWAAADVPIVDVLIAKKAEGA